MHHTSSGRRNRGGLLLLATAIWLFGALNAHASDAVEFRIGYLRLDEKKLALSVLDVPPLDDGIAGAKVAINDNNTTGKFLKQRFILEEVKIAPKADPLPAAEQLVKTGASYLVVDLPAPMVLKIADAVRERHVLVFNAGATDDLLREEECRANVFHTAPARTMLADGLAQYLVWKQWRNWFLISGSHEADKLWADALRRAANRFGAKIVEERPYAFEAGQRRTDTGHQQIQTQMPMLTQGVPDYDIIIVADESDVFGDYVLFRSAEPRPVAGTHGLVAVAWHRSFEEYAGTQMQNRFERKAGRIMTERDYTAWLAVRIVGEAVTRTGSNNVEAVRGYILSDKFEVAGFKGQGMNFRHWDLQLRQPILLAGPRALVSISPQEGFLHPKFLTDTLGFDLPESKCKLPAAAATNGSK
jgi:ABC transporter substrate binding protein (PQQ-dependent alcohol dehydrogenase system)